MYHFFKAPDGYYIYLPMICTTKMWTTAQNNLNIFV